MPTTLKTTIQKSPASQTEKRRTHKTSHSRPTYRWQAGDFTKTLGIQTQVMGIINVTPDSFSHDGLLSGNDVLGSALAQADAMIKAGADILDIGGESSRPGAQEVSIEEEKRRVLPCLEALAKKVSIPLSVDTYKPEVAKAAVDAGASIINIIKGTTLSENFLHLLADTNVGLILMHMYGTPDQMQQEYAYTDCVSEIKEHLKDSIQKCLEKGIASDRIIIDPGIGFGKSVEHNLQLINQIPEFAALDQPILMGTSRKSFIGHILNQEMNKRLYGSLASVCACIMRGAHIVRVHDVEATREAVDVIDAILNEGLT